MAGAHDMLVSPDCPLPSLWIRLDARALGHARRGLDCLTGCRREDSHHQVLARHDGAAVPGGLACRPPRAHTIGIRFREHSWVGAAGVSVRSHLCCSGAEQAHARSGRLRSHEPLRVHPQIHISRRPQPCGGGYRDTEVLADLNTNRLPSLACCELKWPNSCAAHRA